ncbi:division/cell wall cluster transcriptional repressor MraZ [Erysipelothrix sp. HDW6C]|uniref:division/cell wall cluster transcriptional repressor MraZ n=1 Tax=Erysipelothrix sp. HDW6C TaxID=2714930 RepID=UPI00140CE1F7|nr:division/cell wall cluster transcriptional repressor MraZ [Erysipelothrix sp. HDW6C]QIK70375.1 division/cell wall cluster transcriptional repressor MraZ [Erysipelothrix sp. HDW6C]
MFIGEYQHNIDGKGRIIVPAKFREELGDTMIVTRWLDGCLAIYTLEQWQQVYENLKRLPSTKREARMYTHMIMSKAAECDIDNQGRIRIPSHLSQEAALTKNCVLVGVSDHVEIWDKERWDTYYATASENFEEIAESLTEFFE